jgi:amino acid adenylation domain-containing protein/non-ribosomal peptide synthase protein (TIGR01720 family)
MNQNSAKMPSQDLTFELSQSQQLILAGQKLQPDDPHYNMLVVFEIQAELDPDCFVDAFNTLLKNCDALRTVFNHTLDSRLQRQTVLNDFIYTLPIIDFSDNASPSEALEQWLEQRKSINFDLQKCSFDSALIKLAKAKYCWYFNQHHILTDAWSTGVIFQHLQSCYRLIKLNQADEIQPLPPYHHYLKWEQQRRTSKPFKRAEKYWQNQQKMTFVPSSFYRTLPTTKSSKTQRIYCDFGAARSKRFRELAAQDNFRSFSADLSNMQLFASLLFVYLYRVTGNDNLSIGTPSHSRSTPELKKTAGLLINIFPLKVAIEESETFLSLYQKIAAANQNLLINAIPGANSFEQNREFDVLLNYIPSAFGDFAGHPVSTDWVHTGFGDRSHLLRLQVQNFDQADAFTLCFDLNQTAFVEPETQWVGEHFLQLVDGFLANPEQVITYPRLTTTYEQSINPSQGNLATFASVIDWFKQQVDINPNEQALTFSEQHISYAKLEQKSSQLAHYLRTLSLPDNAIIAVMLARSIDSVIAILGTLKAGYAFLPMDLNYPQQRSEHMLKDAKSSLLISVSSDCTEYLADKCQTLLLDKDWPIIHQANQTKSLPNIRTNDRAYVIYTSGSTGQPKGVEITHQGLANYLGWAKAYYLQGARLDFALFSSLGFDLTITSLFLPLISGGKLVIYPEATDVSDITIRNVIEDNQVDVIKLTPAHLALIQVMDFSTSRLKKLIVGGDDFKTELALGIQKYFGSQLDIYNEYGPTEATVACTVHRFSTEHDRQSSVPIGKPIQNCPVYIYDQHFNLVPQGVVGEVFIAGAGLAKGYLHQAELTAHRFVYHPANNQLRLYKTGDLAFFNQNAELEYVGRNDNQIKVNGVRIETNEIEAALLTLPDISETIVDLAKHLSLSQDSDIEEHCTKCGLAANHPSARLNQDRLCRLCQKYEKEHAQAQAYYRNLTDLQNWIGKIKAESKGKQDCIMLLSGGKDSSYALCKLVDMGLTPLVFTLDNGFISQGAKDNIQRLVDRLGLELIIGETPAMNEIFVDSLTRFSNVCNGCFKTIYTLSMNIARKRGIKVICTGLSRGQIFETRVAHLFQQGCFEADKIDQRITDARKAYHRTEDIIATTLDVKIFQDDNIFNEIQYLDYYRYTNVTLDEMYQYLNNIAPWIRPSDTGRSTNCLINDAGIYVHKKERGYHNYALPYSWDVRLGHKEKQAALDELDDEIDLQKVTSILDEIGYKSADLKPHQNQEERLIGYYVAPAEIQKSTLQKHLLGLLPKEYVPSQFVWMKALPINTNGKVDRNALPKPRYNLRDLGTDYIPPVSKTEEVLVALWSQLLGVKEVGTTDNFFDLGGDSIVNIQIVAAAREQGVDITPQQIFDYPTINELAAVAGLVVKVVAEQTQVSGELPLLPSQRRYFDNQPSQVNGYTQSVCVAHMGNFSTQVLHQGLQHLLVHHDGLRTRFSSSATGWSQHIEKAKDIHGLVTEHVGDSQMDELSQVNQQLTWLNQQIDIEQGTSLVARNLLFKQNQRQVLIIAVHHLLMDGVSWWILLNDLERCCEQILAGQAITLGTKSCSVQQWSNAISQHANSNEIKISLQYWMTQAAKTTSSQNHLLSFTHSSSKPISAVRELSLSLDAHYTKQLIHNVPSAFNIQTQELLITALLCTLELFPEALSKPKKLQIDIEGHGRESLLKDYDVMRTIGWFTSVYPALFELTAQQSTGDKLKTTKEGLRSIPKHGVEYGMLRYLSETNAVQNQLAQAPQAKVLFNYMGQWERTLTAGSQFTFVQPIQAHYVNKQHIPYAIELNAMIFEGKLQATFTYDPTKLTSQQIQIIETGYIEQLRKLINFCLSGQQVGLTPADFKGAELQQDDLDDILSEFGEE